MYANQEKKGSDWASPDNLVEYAEETSPAIHLDQLKCGINREAYRVQIERNTAYGTQLMDGSISTPTVYVNGIHVQDISWDGMRKVINEVLKHEGIN